MSLYCTTCGGENPGGSRYCCGCGMPMNAAETQADAEAIIEDVAETYPTPSEPETPLSDNETAVELERIRQEGETARAEIAADAAVETTAIEAAAAVPIAEAEADAAAATAEAVIASEVAEPALADAEPDSVLTPDNADDNDNDNDPNDANDNDHDPADDAARDDVPAVVHPWFRRRW